MKRDKKDLNSNKAKGKVFILWGIIILIGIILISILFVYDKRAEIVLKEKLQVEVYEQVYGKDFIKKIRNGKVISRMEKIDTSTLGEKKISIEYQDYFGRKHPYSFLIKIVDTKAPVIEGQEQFTAMVGEEIHLLDGLKVTDNSLEEIEASIVEEYVFSKGRDL